MWSYLSCSRHTLKRNAKSACKKGRPHGHRFGKSKEQRDCHVAHNLRKRCIKRRFKGVHERFLKDPEFCECQLEHDRTEEVCIQMDKGRAERFLLSNDASSVFSIQKELVDLPQ